MKKDWRMTKLEYEARREAVIEAGQTVDEWGDFSTHQQRMDDIILRTLMTIDSRDDSSWICFSYICDSNVLPPEVVDDMLFIQSGFFDFEKWNWDDETVEKVLEIMGMDDPLTEIARIAKNPNRFPSIYDHCSLLMEKYRLDSLKKLETIDGHIRQLKDDKRALEKKLNSPDWLKTFLSFSISKNVSIFLDDAIKVRLNAKILSALHEDFYIRDRMDWKRLKKKLPKEYVEKRKSLIRKGEILYGKEVARYKEG